MDLPSQTFVDLLSYLLPGFVAAAVFYNLTPSPRPVPFERVVQALIFTILIQVFVAAIGWALRGVGHWLAWGIWSDEVRLTWSVSVAVVLGVVLAHLSNHDTLHGVLRRWRVTHQTSYSSEWYGAFAQNRGYVVLHLAGQRRLYGWPEEWPSTPDKGHFVVAQADWLVDENSIPLRGVRKLLVRAADVEMVEFMEPSEPT